MHHTSDLVMQRPRKLFFVGQWDTWLSVPHKYNQRNDLQDATRCPKSVPPWDTCRAEESAANVLLSTTYSGSGRNTPYYRARGKTLVCSDASRSLILIPHK